MTADDVYKIVRDFIKNDFTHLKHKVDWIFYTLIGGLIAVIILLLRK